jgi:LPXTG-motif cell wall-anchored protein
MRRALALSCALLALAAPGAWAQTGDEQYQDPFAEEDTAPQDEEGGQGGGLVPTPQPGGGETPQDDPAPATPEPSAPAPSPAPAQAGELPRTGADAWLVALLGGGLVLSGAGLRLRTADDDL